jgi:fusion and transport protein UGO1
MFGIISSPNLLIPSLLYHTLSPLFQHCTPIVLDRFFGVQENSTLFITTEFFINLLELIVMLPIETIRKRLQCQVIRKAPMKQERDFYTLVELDPIPYSSFLDCFYRVFGEDSTFKISRLYRGFRVRFMTSVLIALLQFLGHSIERE